MIECLKIEDFVITQMFRPYMPSLLPGDFQGLEYCEEQKKIERKLRSHPKYIIDILERDPETKQRIFNRLRKCGGVNFYRYLDMDNPIIRYVKNSLSEVDNEQDKNRLVR